MAFAIRLAGGRDAAAVARIYRGSVETSPSTFELQPPPVEEMARRIEDTLRAYPWIVAERDGVVVGYAYAARHRVRIGYQWSVETSVYVDEGSRGGRVGKALYTSLCRILRAQGLFNAYAGITLPNPASVALHESVGFEFFAVYRNVGYKFGRWHHVGWWALTLAPHRDEPPPPLELSAVQRRPDWSDLLAAGESLVASPPGPDPKGSDP